MRRFLSIVALLVTPAFASHRHHIKKPKVTHVKRQKAPKIFPAIPSVSVLLENQAGDAMGAWRYDNERDMEDAISRGELVPLDNLNVSRKLPANRRYARPATVAFARQLSAEFEEEFGDTSLMVDSAVRPITVQRKLLRWNRNAAPATGNRASSHERGTTIDISRKMSNAEYRWLVTRLLYYRAIGKVLVIEEKACFHIFVRDYGTVETTPVEGDPGELKALEPR
jgi:hypothetical protein